MKFDNLGSLITYMQDGVEYCLGDLMHFQERGVFDPTLGLVDITPEDAQTHNRLLDEARIAGLDKNCEVGQGGTFYWSPERGVTTFIGTKVADFKLRGKVITFSRAGKTYRGRTQKDAECFNFRRVA